MFHSLTKHLSFNLYRTRHWLRNLPIGGKWGRTQPAPVRRNLRWFWFDGLFASAGDNIVINFITLYILALGANEGQIGLMNSLTNLIGAILLLPGALIAERIIHKKWVNLSFSALGRLAVLMLVFVPIFVKGPAVVWVAIAFSLLRDASGNLAYPAWMAVTHTIVPLEGRGRFFGSRNFVMSITSMIATLLTGKIITLLVNPIGYQIAMAASFVFGCSSIFSYSHIDDTPTDEPQPIPHSRHFSLRSIPGMFLDQPQFTALAITAAVWNFAINISGPFFSVYMVQGLHFSAASVGFLAVVTSMTTLATQNQFGTIADRIGPRRLQVLSMFLIPLLPVAWIFASQVWHIAVINAFSGVVWGMFNLVSFNLLLASIPKAQVPRYSALYQIVVLGSLALGAAVGSAIIVRTNFFVVCIISTIARFIAAGLFARVVHDPLPQLPAQSS